MGSEVEEGLAILVPGKSNNDAPISVVELVGKY